MNALTLVFAALCIFAIAYRFYGLFIANRVLKLDATRATPAVTMNDSLDYSETNRYMIFGHHFAAISAAGPLLGPVLAAQFGFLPGALWILIGCVIGGAVHDMVILFASVRHGGKSLSVIAGKEISRRVGFVASFAILFILILTIAGLSIAMCNSLYQSPWGVFTVAATIPIAILMGLWLFKFRPGDVAGASILAVALLVIAVLTGSYIAHDQVLSKIFSLSENQIKIAIPAYGYVASVLPIWLLLCPRDYLSTYLKLGTIAMLAIGVAIVAPTMQMSTTTRFLTEEGPVFSGSIFPFLFTTIACGAISGFHAVIGSGTTPKMIANERDILFVGYGAMLAEGMVAILALITACVLVPDDYFAINTTAEVFSHLGMTPVHLDELSQAIGMNIAHRPGGAVSLAVGMANILGSIPYMHNLTGYWYHFAIMFQAVFILTAIDTGTRVGRYMIQEMLGSVFPKFQEKRWIPGIIITSFLFTGSWGYLVWTGDIKSIWPVFGMANQLLAGSALIVCTTMLIRQGQAQYAWVTAFPGFFIIPVTMTAGYLNVIEFWAEKKYLLVGLSATLMALMTVVFFEGLIKWLKLFGIIPLARRQKLSPEN